MHKFILAAVATLLGTAAVLTADARQIDGVRTGGFVAAVTLPFGEILAVDTDAVNTSRLQIAKKEKPKSARDRLLELENKVGDKPLTDNEYATIKRSGPSARAPIQGSSGDMRRK